MQGANKMTTTEAVETLVNGNISDFKAWVKRSSKLKLLEAIEVASTYGIKRHTFINKMRRILEN